MCWENRLAWICCAAILVSGQTKAEEPRVDVEMLVQARQMIVRVLDRDGEPVRGLSKSSFEMEVNGKEISDFDFREVAFLTYDDSASSPTTEPGTPDQVQRLEENPRIVVLLLDSRMASDKGMDDLRQTMLAFVESLGPKDMARVYQSERSLTALTPFTNDREVLKKAIREAELKRTVASLERLEQMKIEGFEAFLRSGANEGDLAFYQGLLNNYQLQRESNSGHVLEHLRTLGDVLAPAMADKFLYLFSAGFPVFDGNKHDMEEIAKELNGAGIQLHSLIHFDDPGPTGTMENTPGRWYSRRAQENGPMTFSQRTGGTFVAVEKPSEGVIAAEKLHRQTGHYYALTYYESKKYDKVTVKVAKARANNWDVYFGKNRSHHKPFDKLNKKQKARRFEATLLYGPPMLNLNAELDLWVFRGRDKDSVYTFHGFWEQAEPGRSYQIGWLALDDKDTVIGAGSTLLTVPQEADSLSFYDVMSADKKPHALRFLVQDEQTGEGNLFERRFDESATEGRPHVGAMVMFQGDVSACIPLYSGREQGAQVQEADPFVNNGRRLAVGRKDGFHAEEPIWVLFQLNGLTQPIESYELNGYLEIAGQLRAAGLTIFEFDRLDDQTYRVLGTIDPAMVPGRNAALQVNIKELNGKDGGSFSQSFSLVRSGS